MITLTTPQRNVYISGLALFLALVIKRVLELILKLGKTRGQREELRKEQVTSTKLPSSLSASSSLLFSSSPSHSL